MSKENFNEFIDKIKKENDGEKVQKDLMNKLNSEQTEKLKSVLSDKKALEKLLSTPKAQELLKKFSEGNDG